MKPIDIGFRCKKTDEKVEFKSVVSVDSQGVFHCTIPAFLAESAQLLIDQRREKKGLRDIFLTQPRENWRVSSAVLLAAVDFMRAACEEYLNVETTVELLIVYKTVTNCRFCVGLDGKIYPHGHLANEASGGYEWFENDGIRFSSEIHETYNVGLNAAVVEKVTHRRQAGDKIVYRQPEGEGNTNLGDGYILNNWGKLKQFDYGSRVSRLDDGFKEMPYTPKAELFFHEMLKTMCNMALKFDEFFGKEENILKAIETGKNLLLTKA